MVTNAAVSASGTSSIHGDCSSAPSRLLHGVFFDDPVNRIHWELAWVPKVPTPCQAWASRRALRAFIRRRPDLANSVPGAMGQAMRKLPPRSR
jgi:hypothetical protein